MKDLSFLPPAGAAAVASEGWEHLPQTPGEVVPTSWPCRRIFRGALCVPSASRAPQLRAAPQMRESGGWGHLIQSIGQVNGWRGSGWRPRGLWVAAQRGPIRQRALCFVYRYIYIYIYIYIALTQFGTGSSWIAEEQNWIFKPQRNKSKSSCSSDDGGRSTA